MKKIISSILICLMLCVCSITMFACGESPTTAKDLQEIVGQFVTKVASSSVFTSATTTENNDLTLSKDFSFASDYTSSYFNESKDFVYAYDYIYLTSMPLNYIKSVSAELGRLDEVESMPSSAAGIFSNIAKNIDAFYQILPQTEAETMSVNEALSRKAEIGETVYNAYIGEYKSSLVKLADKAYDIALDLSRIKGEVFGDFTIKGEEEFENLKALSDFQNLKLARIMFNILCQNLDGEKLEGQTVNVGVFQNFISFARTQIRHIVEDMQAPSFIVYKEQLAEIEQINAQMDNEINYLYSALNSFSLVDYYFRYDCNLKNYEKVDKNATYNYEEIYNFVEKYYPAYNNYMELYYQI